MEILKRRTAPNGKYFSVNVRVKGIKKRCRKVSSEFITIGLIPYRERFEGQTYGEQNYSKEELAQLDKEAQRLILATMREVQSVPLLDFSKVEIEGCTLKGMIFDESNFKLLLAS
jgi:hypothetical protein